MVTTVASNVLYGITNGNLLSKEDQPFYKILYFENLELYGEQVLAITSSICIKHCY